MSELRAAVKPRSSSMRRLAGVVTIAAAVSCGDSAPGDDSERGSLPSWDERLDSPSVENLLAALAQPHRQIRASLGPHTLHYVARFTLAPEGGEIELPNLDEPVVIAQDIRDELTLNWATTDERDPRFALAQANNHDRGREIVLVDGTFYSRTLPRGWFHTAVETDIYELWLDDAQRCIHDALELVAPDVQLAYEPASTASFAEAKPFTVRLSAPDTPAARSGSDWRATVVPTAIGGTITLDAHSGAWLSAEIAVEYTLTDPLNRKLRGSVAIRGTVEPLSDAQSAARAPADAQPSFERTRYETERRRLLDGLAGS